MNALLLLLLHPEVVVGAVVPAAVEVLAAVGGEHARQPELEVREHVGAQLGLGPVLRVVYDALGWDSWLL